jgi:tRNA-2-methylthio-N6-dimethylallyladenosine synthase
METTDDLDQADVVVLNTCCIRENADNKLYGHLGHLKALQARPGLQIAVGGCLAQKDKGLIQARAGHVDAVFGTHNVGQVVELLHRAEREGPVMEILDQALPDDESFASALPVQRQSAHAAWVTIQVGCDNSCAFCIVPAVRGPEASRPFGQVLGEVEALAAAGTSEITLLGQNVNSYGRDITTALRTAGGPDPCGPPPDATYRAGAAWAGECRLRARALFADLLRAVGSVPGISRVRFTSPHPKDLRPDVIAAMADTQAVCEHLHLPLQSGSDRILAAMRRGYTAQRYLDKLSAARAVGFPGETDAEFQATLEVVAAAEYDGAYTFVFSPRPGTRAAQMRDRFVAADVVSQRFARLEVVVNRSALAKHRARLGLVEEVMIEGPSKRDPGRLTGRTRQHKLVHLPRPAPDDPVTHALVPGASVLARITDAAAHHLAGELVEVVAPPRHPGRRSRIPVTAG